MKKLFCVVISVFMLIGLLGTSSCSMIKYFVMPSEEVEDGEEEERTVTLPEEETGPVTIPDKGCTIDFPKRKPYEYDMDLTLDTEANTIGGHVVIWLYNDSHDNWKDLILRDYPSLFDKADVYANNIKKGGGITKIDNIKDSRTGKLKSAVRHHGDSSLFGVNLDKELEPGETMKLSYDFVAKIPDNADRFGYSNNVYCVTNFYPILAEYVDGAWSQEGYIITGECFYSEISNYNVRLTVPEGYIVASSGEMKDSSSGNGKLTYTFEAPYVRDFVFCASNVFASEQKEVEGVKVNVFYNRDNPPGNDMSAVIDKTFESAGNSFKAFGDAFGKYPYSELDIVISPMAAGGMEYPNLIIITDYVCKKEMSMYNSYDQLEVVVCHEIAHQWFMGIVGSNSGAEPWLDESVASYAELVYYEYLGGDKETTYLRRYGKSQYNIVDKWKNNEKLDIAYSEFEDDGAYAMRIYLDGKAALYQMEEIIGREKFHGIIRGYVKRNAFKNANTKDFLKALYDCAGKDNDELNELVGKIFRTTI